MLDRIKNYAALAIMAALVWASWFVWPGVVRAADTPLLPLAYETSTLGVDYPTMVAWETAKVRGTDMATAEMGQVLILPSGTYTEWVEISANTSADYFPVIMAAPGAVVTFAPTALGHIGEYASSINYSVATWAPYTKFIGLNFDWAGLNGIHNNYLKAPILIHSDIPHVRVVNCSVQNVSAPEYIGAGIAAFSAGTTDVGIINSAVGACDYGIALFNGADGFLYNDTVKGCTTGYYANASTPTAKNCLAAGNTTDWSGTWTKTSCLDATPTWLSGTEFDIDPGDTTVLGQGDDLSADATFALSYDRNNDTRSTLWSVGADDAAAAEPDPDPEPPAVRRGPWFLGPWGAGPWSGGGSMGRWN